MTDIKIKFKISTIIILAMLGISTIGIYYAVDFAVNQTPDALGKAAIILAITLPVALAFYRRKKDGTLNW